MKQIEKSLDEERQFMHSLKVMASKLETDIEKELSVNPDLLNTKKSSPSKISGGFDRRVLIARYKDN